MAESGPNSRRSDARANHEKIVAAARKLASGRALPSMQAIADAAGVGVMTLYRRFPTRDLLISHIVALDFCDQLQPAFERALANPDAMQGMQGLTRELVVLAARHTDPQCGMKVGLVDLLDIFLDRHLESLVRLMRIAQASGELRGDIEEADIPRIAAIMLGGLALPERLNDAPERYIALIFEGLRRQTEGGAVLPSLPKGDVPKGDGGN